MIALLLATGVCLTPAHLEEAKLRKRELPAVHLASAEKLIRDAHGTFTGQRTSTNFVLKWGPSWALAADTATQDRILRGFEDGWAGQVERMGHPGPGGTDAYRLNVYVGNSGAPAPEIPDYAGGYATIDAEGYPMIVMHPDMLQYATVPEYGIYVDITAVHELYHTVQFATGAYEDYLVSGWYWEATAVWAETAVYPDLAEARSFMGMYAIYPHFPIDFFDYPDEGKLVEYHQYAAGVFPAFLDDEIGGEELIRESWLSAGANDDPLRKLDELLAVRGTSLDDEFTTFSARFAAYDVAFGDYIKQYADSVAQQYPDQDDRIVANVSGNEGLKDAPTATLPGPHGYNVILLASPQAGDLVVEIAPEETGSKGHASSMRATVVRVRSAGNEYIAVDGETRVSLDGNEEDVLLVVASQPATRDLNETFGYAYRMEYAGNSSGGGVCSVTQGAGSPLSLLPFALLLLRRRR